MAPSVPGLMFWSERTQDAATLRKIGFTVDFDKLPDKAIIPADHPGVVEEDILASSMVRLICCLERYRQSSLGWHTEALPGKLALMMGNAEEQERFLVELERDLAVYEACLPKAAKSSFHARYVRSSQNEYGGAQGLRCNP